MSSRSASLARKPHKLTTQPVVESPALDAAAGLVYLSAALFYLLALISHNPADLPAWTHLAVSDTPTSMAHNLIGRLGAVMAGYSFWMLGAANYLIPTCLTWFGVCKFSSCSKVTLRSWIGLAMMVASGAAILYLQNIWPWEDKDITPYGAGGGLGYVVGGRLMVGIFGEVGSLLMLGAAYLIGLVFMTGLHPVQVVLHGKDAIVSGVANWWDERKRRKMEAEDLATLPFTVPPPEPRAKKRKIEDQDKDQLELPPVQPLPKIVDASVPKAPAPKPALAEVWKKRAAQKQERVATALPTSLTARFKDYRMPPLDLLHYPDVKGRTPADEYALREMQNSIIRTLATFDIRVTAGDITKGPAITRYEVYPVDGLRVSRIANLEADLARATKAERINILAPIPGKDTVGIELPNRDKIVVPIRELLEDEEFQKGRAKLPLALGKDVYGKAIIADLATMPHLLVAGATGSGKSVCINSIITSLLCRYAPDELRFIMIDPKVVEMQGYKDLPHLALPVVTDPKLALLALRWVVNEMEKRYQIFAKEGCRNFETFNNRHSKTGGHKVSTSRVGGGTGSLPVGATGSLPVGPEIAPPPAETKFKSANKAKGGRLPHPDAIEDGDVLDQLDAEDGYEAPTGPLGWFGSSEPPPRKEPELEIPDTLPYLVVIVDELADLMQTAPADIEIAIARIAQKARAAGIHLILATQTPRADVVTGIIKANIPCRIAFQVSSALDSRVILDRKGADRLVGKGDMLYLPPGTSQLVRAQGTMVTDDELHGLVDHACNQGKPLFEATLATGDELDDEGDGEEITAEDEATLEKILEILRAERKASTSHIQRRLRLGYNRAARMMDILEARGIIGPADGAKPREILVEL